MIFNSSQLNIVAYSKYLQDFIGGTSLISFVDYNNEISVIKAYAFAYDTNIQLVSFPKCVSIGSWTFFKCTELTSVDFPNCITIGNSAFYNCKKLTTTNFSLCTTVKSFAFLECHSIATLSFPACTNIGQFAFWNCYNLKSFYLMCSSIPTLQFSDAFSNTPIGGYSASTGTYGSIYVPASLIEDYKVATNWSYFSSRFVGI